VGSEANHILRVEKGFISMGHEADGIATPFDLGLGWAVKMDKPFFVGQAALRRLHPEADLTAAGRPVQDDRQDRTERHPPSDLPGRPELVGLVPLDGGGPFEEGAALLADVTLVTVHHDESAAAASAPTTLQDGSVVADPWNHAEGFVTASVHSPACGHAIALALLDGGHSRIGQTVRVTAQPAASAAAGSSSRLGTGLTTRRARVVAPLFHDPTGALMRG
jgi:sarcosine oxidase subunit alpha